MIAPHAISRSKSFGLIRQDSHKPLVMQVSASAAAAGKRLGIVTSKTQAPTRRGLDVCGFNGVFATIVAADDVERPKPHPEPVLTASGGPNWGAFALGLVAAGVILLVFSRNARSDR